MRITVFDDIDINLLREKIPDFEEVDITDNPNAIILRSEDLHKKELPASLAVICRAGSGVDNIPVDWCNENGIPVLNAAGVNANAVAELTLWGILEAYRNLAGARRYIATLRTSQLDKEDVESDIKKNKGRFRGAEIVGKKILVVGVGAIGLDVAHNCSDLGMIVSGHDPNIDREKVKSISIIDSLDDLRMFDCITLHVPDTESTRHMINTDFLRNVKTGVKLINNARDTMVDTDALIKALAEGRVGVYVSDFPTKKLLDAQRRFGEERILLTPHIGAETEEAQEGVLAVAVKRLLSFWNDGTIEYSVNFPRVLQEQSGPSRILVSDINVPNIIGQITSVIGEAGYNIASYNHKIKGGVGYGIIDIDTVTESVSRVAEHLRNVEGVTRVRALVF